MRPGTSQARGRRDRCELGYRRRRRRFEGLCGAVVSSAGGGSDCFSTLPHFPAHAVTTPMRAAQAGTEPPDGWRFCADCDTLGWDMDTNERCPACLGRGICRRHDPPAGHAWCPDCNSLGGAVGAIGLCSACGGRGIIRVVPASRGGEGTPPQPGNGTAGRDPSDDEMAWLCGVPRSVRESNGR